MIQRPSLIRLSLIYLFDFYMLTFLAWRMVVVVPVFSWDTRAPLIFFVVVAVGTQQYLALRLTLVLTPSGAHALKVCTSAPHSGNARRATHALECV